MGNSSLKEKFSSLEPVQLEGFWNVYDGVIKAEKGEEGEKVTVFVFNQEFLTKKKETGKWNPWTAALTTCKRMKVLQHPNLIRYKESFISEANKECYICTEPVYPFLHILAGYCTSDIIVALSELVRGALFLHENDLSHNNICLESIYVARNRNFTACLGDLQFAGPFTENTQAMLTQTRAWRHPKTSVCPEEEVANIGYADAPIHTRDSYAMGQILHQLLDEPAASFQMKRRLSVSGRKNVDRVPLGHIIKEIRKMIAHTATKETSIPQPGTGGIQTAHHTRIAPQRPPLENFATLTIFNRCTQLKLLLLLEELPVLPEGIKIQLFHNLHVELLKLPYEIIVQVFLPRMLKENFFADRSAINFLPHLLVPYRAKKGPLGKTARQERVGLLYPDTYESRMIPFIKRLFKGRKRDVRYRLMQTVDTYL
eukprot:gene17142-746_t